VDLEVSQDTADATRIPTLPRGIGRVQVEPHPPVARPGMGRGRRS